MLECARRVGLGWDFDELATQYYTSSFQPGSALALEQRLSRNRRLPGLLSQLRQCLSTWGTSQRRGYEDESIKTAEQICVRELGEFFANTQRHRDKVGEGGSEGVEQREGDGGSDTLMFEDHVSFASKKKSVFSKSLLYYLTYPSQSSIKGGKLGGCTTAAEESILPSELTVVASPVAKSLGPPDRIGVQRPTHTTERADKRRLYVHGITLRGRTGHISEEQRLISVSEAI